jgi:ABC-2 type transport system permease protein
MFKKRLHKIYSSRRILWDLSVRNLKTKYAGSKLGLWWAIATPLLLALSISGVFSGVFRIEMPRYTFFVLAGIVPWFFLSNALLETANSFPSSSSVLKQSFFPREFIPCSVIIAQLLNFLLGLLCLLPFFLVPLQGKAWACLFLLPVVFVHFIFVLGLGILLSTVSVFFRDLVHFLNIFFMVLFWLTPVFYTQEMASVSFRRIIAANPVTLYTVLYQKVLCEGIPPDPSVFWTAACVSAAVFLGGYAFFLKHESELLKRI